MTETPGTYTPVDVDQLLPDQARMLRFVLSVLSLHQLVLLANRVRKICGGSGFGSVAVTIENHHLRRIVTTPSANLFRNLEPDAIEELMEEASDVGGKATS